MKKFEFLTSTRFWALVVAALVLYARTKGVIADAEVILIETILGGFIGVRTIDRASEKIGGE